MSCNFLFLVATMANANIFAYYAICEYFWTPSKKIISIFCVMGEPTERKFIAPDINFSATII